MASKFTYDDGVRELMQIVEQLERGETPLDESFKAFERGMKLAEKLKKILNDGDARIRELTNVGEKAFDAEEEV